ncbi:MAG TPA: AarF/UbiB family protein [Gemmatimonadaceae bacterium]|jgi:predicted unusual protein kinase regulating ubiquinone biosynthesis (AarF/ABC1/UbiB family)
MILEPKYLPRLAATVALFTRYGLADFARQQGLRGIAPDPDSDDAAGAPSPEKAMAFRKRLVELGPAYVKLGQVLSTRPDLLPEAYIAELERLQDDVCPIPASDVRATIEAELGARISKLFDEFTDDPIGSASLGQVHAATLRDGRDVVVKVQRPHIREQLADDIEYFRELATFLTAHTEIGARVDMLGIIHQLERALVDELDYRIEARNAAAFRRSLAEFPRVLIPRVVEGFTTHKVLTTERINGVKISEISPLTRIEHDFHPVADELTRAYLKQITIDGHFHADPHPGNVFVVLADRENPLTPSEAKAIDRRRVPRRAVTPLARMEAQAQRNAAPEPDDVDVRLSLIDFGMTARLSAALRDQIIRLLLDLSDNRGDDVAATLIEIGDPIPAFDAAPYSRDIASLMARHYDLAIGDVEAGAVLYELINISFQRGLRLPAELTLLAKALFNLDAVTRALDPTYNPIATIREFGKQIAEEKARRELNPRKLLQLVMHGGDFLFALPHRLDLVTQRLAAGDFAMRVDVPQLTVLLNGLQKVANRIFSGLVLAAIIIASAMLITTRKTLGTWGFIVAGAVSAWMVIAIWWGDRTKRR